MQHVFVLQHLNSNSGDGCDDVKFIGVYSSRENAMSAIARLKNEPGFRDNSNLIDPSSSDGEDGFYIDECEINLDHWTEGFGW